MAEAASVLKERVLVVAVTVGCFSALVGLMQLVPWPVADWRTGLTVLSVVLLVAYGLHRYEQVRLDLVREGEP